MSAIDMITVRLDSGESITLTTSEVMWFGRDGGIIGHCALEEFRVFCAEILAGAKADAKEAWADGTD